MGFVLYAYCVLFVIYFFGFLVCFLWTVLLFVVELFSDVNFFGFCEDKGVWSEGKVLTIRCML